MADERDEELPSGSDDIGTLADRPAAKSPEGTSTPSTRVSAPGIRASLFPRMTNAPRRDDTVMSQAADAMRDDEITRLHMFYKVIVVVVAGCISVLPSIEGDLTAKWLFVGGLLAYLASMTVFVLQVSRDATCYAEHNFYLPGLCGVLAAYTGIYFWGPYSPAPAIVVMALYFNSLVGSFRYTFAVYLACAGLQALLVGLIMAGALTDVGLVRAGDLSPMAAISSQALIQLALLATFLIGRLSRRSTLQSIERFEGAVRDVAQREALLNEARQELERAAWVGGPGRFTEQTLGSYRLGLIIGRGAMGEVYEGFNDQNGEAAAVKLLHRNFLSDPATVVRFAREADAISSLDSPHVVKVLEVGDPTSPVPYIAMERMVGDDLAAELRARRKLPLDEVVRIVTQAARGIDAAARAGVVHRDLKPQNLFFHRGPNGDGVWKILDFGVSKLADGTGTLTRGRVVGTPTYMAPEQARGKEVDHRADIYALGAIAYRALTGHPAFTGREIPQILYDVVHRTPTQPTRLAPELSSDVDRVLAIALAKKPGDRFQTAAELADAMGQAAEGALTPELWRRAESRLKSFAWH